MKKQNTLSKQLASIKLAPRLLHADVFEMDQNISKHKILGKYKYIGSKKKFIKIILCKSFL